MRLAGRTDRGPSENQSVALALAVPSRDSLHKSREDPVAREQRKLAAILAADVVGYSYLMGRDESTTLGRQSRQTCRLLN